MGIELIDRDNAADVEQLLNVLLAAHREDRPDFPEQCRVEYRAALMQPNEDEELRVYVMRDGERIVGLAMLSLPLKENQHFVWGNVVVHPRYRRRGIGSALVTKAIETTREQGRKTLNLDTIDTWQDGPRRPEAGKALLEKRGFTLALTEVNRVADITAIDPVEEQRMLDESLSKSDEYETIAWQHRVPEELLEPVAKLNSIFLDEAPLGDLDLEAQKLDGDRIRKGNDRSIARGFHMMGVVARRKGSTELVANTVIGVPTEPGDVAYQWITLVDPKHRGHRLGMRVKLENLRQLRSQRPKVTRILTDNADVNAHMVAINDALGFKPVDLIREYQIDV